VLVLCPDPRPISRLGHAGRPYRPWFPHAALASDGTADAAAAVPAPASHFRRLAPCERRGGGTRSESASWEQSSTPSRAEQHAEARMGKRRVGTARARGGVWRQHEVCSLSPCANDGSACMKAWASPPKSRHCEPGWPQRMILTTLGSSCGVLADYNPSELTFQLTKLAKPICMHRFEVSSGWQIAH